MTQVSDSSRVPCMRRSQRQSMHDFGGSLHGQCVVGTASVHYGHSPPPSSTVALGGPYTDDKVREPVIGLDSPRFDVMRALPFVSATGMQCCVHKP